jgi:hypothetical protein
LGSRHGVEKGWEERRARDLGRAGKQRARVIAHRGGQARKNWKRSLFRAGC